MRQRQMKATTVRAITPVCCCAVVVVVGLLVAVVVVVVLFPEKLSLYNNNDDSKSNSNSSSNNNSSNIGTFIMIDLTMKVGHTMAWWWWCWWSGWPTTISGDGRTIVVTGDTTNSGIRSRIILHQNQRWTTTMSSSSSSFRTSPLSSSSSSSLVDDTTQHYHQQQRSLATTTTTTTTKACEKKDVTLTPPQHSEFFCSRIPRDQSTSYLWNRYHLAATAKAAAQKDVIDDSVFFFYPKEDEMMMFMSFGGQQSQQPSFWTHSNVLRHAVGRHPHEAVWGPFLEQLHHRSVAQTSSTTDNTHNMTTTTTTTTTNPATDVPVTDSPSQQQQRQRRPPPLQIWILAHPYDDVDNVDNNDESTSTTEQGNSTTTITWIHLLQKAVKHWLSTRQQRSRSKSSSSTTTTTTEEEEAKTDEEVVQWTVWSLPYATTEFYTNLLRTLQQPPPPTTLNATSSEQQPSPSPLLHRRRRHRRPDVILHALSRYDMTMGMGNNARDPNTVTWEEERRVVLQDFIRAARQAYPPSIITRCRGEDANDNDKQQNNNNDNNNTPVVLFLDDYIPTTMAAAATTSSSSLWVHEVNSRMLQQLADYYDVGLISYAQWMQRWAYATETTAVSSALLMTTTNQTTKSTTSMVGGDWSQLGHYTIFWALAYALLDFTTVYCSSQVVAVTDHNNMIEPATATEVSQTASSESFSSFSEEEEESSNSEVVIPPPSSSLETPGTITTMPSTLTPSLIPPDLLQLIQNPYVLPPALDGQQGLTTVSQAWRLAAAQKQQQQVLLQQQQQQCGGDDETTTTTTNVPPVKAAAAALSSLLSLPSCPCAMWWEPDADHTTISVSSAASSSFTLLGGPILQQDGWDIVTTTEGANIGRLRATKSPSTLRWKIMTMVFNDKDNRAAAPAMTRPTDPSSSTSNSPTWHATLFVVPLSSSLSVGKKPTTTTAVVRLQWTITTSQSRTTTKGVWEHDPATTAWHPTAAIPVVLEVPTSTASSSAATKATITTREEDLEVELQLIQGTVLDIVAVFFCRNVAT